MKEVQIDIESADSKQFDVEDASPTKSNLAKHQ